MRKILTIFLTIIFTIIIFTGCNNDTNGNGNGTETKTAEGFYTGMIDNNSLEVSVDEEFMVFRKTGMTDYVEEIGLLEGDKVKITYRAESDGNMIEKIEVVPYKTSQGMFTGFADSNSFEIIDSMEGYRSFFRSGAATDFGKLGLKTGDEVKVDYIFQDPQNLALRMSIVKAADKELKLQDQVVILNGVVDNNSFEVTAGDQILVMRIIGTPDKFQELGIKEQDKIDVTWYQNDSGQLIVVWIFKTE